MKTQLKKIDKLKRQLEITVDADALRVQKESIYKELSKSLKTPGFRPGTAPFDVLEKHHGKILREEFLKRAIPHFYNQALEQEKLTVAAFPQINDVTLSDGILRFTAEFEVKPELSISQNDYKGLPVRFNSVKVEEIEKEKMITHIKESITSFWKKDISDNDIARWSGYKDADSFKEALSLQIMMNKLQARHNEIENGIAEELLKRIPIEVPKAVFEQHHTKLLEQEIYKLRMKDVSDDDIKKYEAELKEKIKPLAQKQVKLYYILERIAEQEGLKVEDNNLFTVVIGYILSCAIYKE